MSKAAKSSEATTGTGSSVMNIAEQRFIPFMQDDEYLFIDYPAATKGVDIPEFPGETLDQESFTRELTSAIESDREQMRMSETGGEQDAAVSVPEN